MKIRQPFVIVLSGPSGVGKTSLCQKVLKRDKQLKYSVSVTSRSRRKGEVNGRDYYFLTVTNFQKKIKANELLEWAIVYSHYYGTPRQPVEEGLNAGYDVIMDLDVKGGTTMMKCYPKGVFIFVMPSSLSVLKERLVKRGTDTEKAIKERLSIAQKEMTFLKHYDYVVINKNIEETVKNICGIIRAERCRVFRWKLE
ncbi:MAG: guanylate kinase [Candidatus Edwardsbacteria bacterium]